MKHIFFFIPLSHTFQDLVVTSGLYTHSIKLICIYSCSGTKTHTITHTYFLFSPSLSAIFLKIFFCFYIFWDAFTKFLSHVGQFLCSYPMETNVIGISIYMYIYTNWTFSFFIVYQCNYCFIFEEISITLLR